MRIQRDFYLKQLIERHQNGQVKVITGTRRSGKSYLLFQLFFQYLINQEVSAKNIICIALDDVRYAALRNPIKLIKYIEERINESEDFYILIDEIQCCEKIKNKALDNAYITFYDVLNSLLRRSNLDVYVTGSNSKMLSTDILTEFRGRGDEIRVFPLSFSEFFQAKGGDKESALDEYLLFGGMPQLLNYTSVEAKISYLRRLFEKTYFTDIVERQKVQSEELLSQITDCLCSSTGSLTNIHTLTNTINSRYQTNAPTKIYDSQIKRYTDFLIQSYLFEKVKRFDVKGKRFIANEEKYYCVDVGLRNVRLNMRQIEPSRAMENVIFIDLLRRGCAVDVGIVESFSKNKEQKTIRTVREIDFVVNSISKRYYIQSAFSLDDADKIETEIKPLRLIRDGFQKIIVTRKEPLPFYDENGVFHIGLADFLLRQNLED